LSVRYQENWWLIEVRRVGFVLSFVCYYYLGYFLEYSPIYSYNIIYTYVYTDMDAYLETEKLVIIYHHGCYPREWEKIPMQDFSSIVTVLIISRCGIGDAVEESDLGELMIWEGREDAF
jgi:hypothetical protein